MTSFKPITFLIIAFISAVLIISCSEETQFTAVSLTELPENFDLCFADESGNCETNENGTQINEKTVTFNTCNETSVVRIKALGDGINEETQLLFYLQGATFYGDDINTGVCARGDIICYCPTSDENIDQEITIIAEIADRRSNELDLVIKKREEIIENYDFAAEIIFISDYQCNSNQCLQPHLNIFDFNKSDWNAPYNNLDEDLEAFMPVVFSEGEQKSFGTENYNFACSSDLFEYEGRENGWCVAIEDWFCGHSDQDYDYVMTYETESNPEIGYLRTTFTPVSHFGAKNFHIVKLIFETNESRLLKYAINQDLSGAWINYDSGEIEVTNYNEEADGRFSYEYLLPAGNILFQTQTAEILFSIEALGE